MRVFIHNKHIHLLTGCGIANTCRDFEKLWNAKNKKKWRALKVLVIDEVSMIDASFLEFLDVNVRNVRGNGNEAFGGLQLIFCGDFCQLPGITRCKYECLYVYIYKYINIHLNMYTNVCIYTYIYVYIFLCVRI